MQGEGTVEGYLVPENGQGFVVTAEEKIGSGAFSDDDLGRDGDGKGVEAQVSDVARDKACKGVLWGPLHTTKGGMLMAE